ncbi:MAG TPA: alpha/beta hydrolase, partial [Gemmatimonadales bacterium]|nr:alpha/beta hydrolase [Gemmatimonadales bacterium]
CSYDRGGYAWSDPGTVPRTFAQLALELHTALVKLGERPPYLLVGQSYGGLVVRGFYRAYPAEVAGMVLVDAVHEDQRVVYGGQPHRIRDGAQGRVAPRPRIALDSAAVAEAARTPARAIEPLEAPLDRLPPEAQRLWQWAAARPGADAASSRETDWSPEELARMHEERLANRATLGDLPLIVLARGAGGYPDGMSVSADSLERERRALQADLAALSKRGRLTFVSQSGHNIHVEDPAAVIAAIHELVAARH